MQHPSLKAVVERFPGVGDKAADVFEQDDNFRELCLEYEACLESVGRLGCSHCYEAFAEHLGILLKKIHGSGQHLGKTPAKMAPAVKEKVFTPIFLLFFFCFVLYY